MKCINCEKELSRPDSKYCSSKCQSHYQRMIKVNLWLKGELNGMRGKTSTVKWIKWYLIQTYGEKCMYCGWCERNNHTGNIPIELSHKDGDFTNNNINNLELICPNCHSLTDSYKGGNKKKGRPRSKYYRGL